MNIHDDMTREQLINDLIKLRQRINELEKIEEDKQRYLEELNKTRAMFEGLFEFAPDAIIAVDFEGRIVQVNRQTERLFGYTREELLSTDHDILVPERFKKKHLENRKEYMSGPHTRHMGTGLELYGRKKDGSEFPVDIALGPMQIGKDLVVLAVVRDFTERKSWAKALRESNEVLLRRNLELKRAYKDMESFSYAASHDLRSPVITIEGFSKMLLEDYAGKLDDNGKDLLNRISNSAKKMNRLIADLLAFSRVSTKEILKYDFNMEELARKLVADLTPTLGGRVIKFEIKQMPSAYGDLFMMDQVLLNLLSNAIKFTQTRETARIEVGGYSEKDENVYCVEDNGIGFDMQLSARLFGLFQRLHSSKETEGTGIGLVIVKNIVEKHGGRVWAEGRPDKGAKFCFTLPRKKEQDRFP
jgi:PAS domain S-box-containing protein